MLGETLVASVLPSIPITPTSCPAHHSASLHPLLCSWTSRGLGPRGSRSVWQQIPMSHVPLTQWHRSPD